jgi:hypothetical protein
MNAPLRLTTPGIYPEVDPKDYHADPCPTPSLSNSIAKTILEHSLEHAWVEHPRLNPNHEREEAKRFDLGNCAHTLFLGRGKRFAILHHDNYTTKAAKLERDEAIAAGRQPVLEMQHARAVAMAELAKIALADYPDDDGVPMIADFQHGAAEVMLVARDGDTWLRTLLDWWPQSQRFVYDYKTTAVSIAPGELDRKMWLDGWHIQAAFHEHLLEILDPQFSGRRKHRFVVQETFEPFAVQVAEIPEDAMTIGRKQVANAMRQWRQAMNIGTHREAWQGYPRRICYPHIPEWAENKWLAREIAEREDMKRSRNEPMLDSVAGG